MDTHRGVFAPTHKYARPLTFSPAILLGGEGPDMADGDRRTPVDGFEWMESGDDLAAKRPNDKDWQEMVRRYQDQRDKTLIILREDDRNRKETLDVLRDIKTGMANGFPMPRWAKWHLAVTAFLCLAVAILFWLVLRAVPVTSARMQPFEPHAAQRVSSQSEKSLPRLG
jgi:hypothetical protein